MKAEKALLLSIRPRFVEQILAGSKAVELRRVRPRVNAGDLIVVYASGDQKAIVGAFAISAVVAEKPAKLWRRFGPKTGMSKREFDSYFEGVSQGYGFEVGKRWQLPKPVTLAVLRKTVPGFHPPQSYRYMEMQKIELILGATLFGSAKRG